MTRNALATRIQERSRAQIISAKCGRKRGALFVLEARVIGDQALIPRVGSLSLAFPLGREGPNYNPSPYGCGGNVSVDSMSVEVR